jgi:hypothetical protein
MARGIMCKDAWCRKPEMEANSERCPRQKGASKRMKREPVNSPAAKTVAACESADCGEASNG